MPRARRAPSRVQARRAPRSPRRARFPRAPRALLARARRARRARASRARASPRRRPRAFVDRVERAVAQLVHRRRLARTLDSLLGRAALTAADFAFGPATAARADAFGVHPVLSVEQSL